jgi:AcrR family transcriptional regulator
MRAAQRVRLSREAILEAARRLSQVGGVGVVSMRRLARELDVMPNALYTYVPNKAAILDGLLDSLLADVRRPRAAVGPWHERLIWLMSDSRRVLLAHPQLPNSVR